MKKHFLLIIIFLVSISIFSQRNEYGVFAGGSYYLGELNPGTQFLLTRPAFGILYRYNFVPRFAYKLNIFYGTVEGADSVSKANAQRNLSFKSTVIEMSNEIELNFIQYVPGNKNYPFTPYIFTGFTFFYFDPMAKYNGSWYALETLGTEGQGTSEYPGVNKYSRVAFAIPFGIGLKYNLSKMICLGLEWSMRKTFTDYLDDVSGVYADPKILAGENGPIAAALADRSKSTNGEVKNNTGLQRGNASNNDWYSFAGLIVTFKISNRKQICPIYKQHYNYKEYKLYQ